MQPNLQLLQEREQDWIMLILDIGQVFYDYNLINDKMKMLNAGIEIKMDF